MNSTILIVGASSGIGKETALIFSKKNWKVIACSRNVKKLNDLSKLSINKIALQNALAPEIVVVKHTL